MRGSLLISLFLALLVALIVGVIVLAPPPGGTPGREPGLAGAPGAEVGAVPEEMDIAAGPSGAPSDMGDGETGTINVPIGGFSADGGPDTGEAAGEPEPALPSVAGVVTDIRGAPLTGAEVSASGIGSATTGGDGRFEIGGVENETVTLIADMEGYSLLRKDGVPAGSSDVELVLAREGTLSGRVANQFGEPLASAKVMCRALEGVWVKNLLTDSRGRFEEPSPPEGQVEVSATLRGFFDTGEGAKTVNSPPDELVQLTLNQETHHISGTVTLRDSGEPAAGFRLIARKVDTGLYAGRGIAQGPAGAGSVDSNGNYRIGDLKPGSYEIVADAAGNEPLNLVPAEGQTPRQVALYGESAEGVDFVAVEGYRVDGVVLDGQGNPVPDANVMYKNQENGYSVTTKSGGVFNIMAIPGSYLIARHPTLGSGLSDILEESDSEERIQIRLRSPGGVNGEIIDENGQPVANAEVKLYDRGKGLAQETTSGPDGVFAFDTPIQASFEQSTNTIGTHIITAQKEGYAQEQIEMVINDGGYSTVTLVLRPGNTIHGFVMDLAGFPVAGARVTAFNTRTGSIFDDTDTNGSFTLSIPAGETADLHADYDSIPSLSGSLFQVPAGTQDALIRLHQQKWILRGRVTNPSTQSPVADPTITLAMTPTDPNAQPVFMVNQFRNPSGFFELSVTEPGHYEIRASAPGFAPADQGIDISHESDPVFELNFELPSNSELGSIHGTFAPPPGMALKGVEVLGLKYEPVGNEFYISDVPAGMTHLVFYCQDDEIMYDKPKPIGVLPYVEVKPAETTEIPGLSFEYLLPTFRIPSGSM